jgi:hypothetical protein
MVHRGPLPAAARGAVEVARTELEPLRRKRILAQPWGSPEVADQLLGARAMLEERVTVRYFASLEDGEIPLLLLFSGTVFVRTPTGFAVGQVPWTSETQQRVPVSTWREAMDRFFPGSGWLRLRRDTIAELQRYKADHALAGWDDVVADLLKRAGEA